LKTIIKKIILTDGPLTSSNALKTIIGKMYFLLYSIQVNVKTIKIFHRKLQVSCHTRRGHSRRDPTPFARTFMTTCGSAFRVRCVPPESYSGKQRMVSQAQFSEYTHLKRDIADSTRTYVRLSPVDSELNVVRR
jgi:hypothetical protein